MKRRLIENLEKWETSKNRKPLLLEGARQVGKTWLLKEFGRLHFKQVAYVSLDKSRVLRDSFAVDTDVKRILGDIALATGTRITPGETLVIIDEIQTVPSAITSLKYFCEDTPEIAVTAAGSLLGVATNYGSGFPVGKTDHLTLYPMTFLEFLEAIGEELLAERIDARDWGTLSRFHDQVTRRLRQYYFTGGMPAAVAAFTHDEDYQAARREQLRILSDYRRDFAKHISREGLIENIRLTWDSIPRQLAHENGRFVFGAVREGARGRTLESAISWLTDAGVIHQVKHISKPNLPLSAYTTSAFKIYGLDVGLLSAQCELDPTALLDGNRVFTEFKGILTEQYVQQELRATQGLTPYYWSSENATSEVDFLVSRYGAIFPLEVKAEQNLKAKSLKVYCDKYAPPIAVKIAMTPYAKQLPHLTLPLYGVSQLSEEIRL